MQIQIYYTHPTRHDEEFLAEEKWKSLMDLFPYLQKNHMQKTQVDESRIPIKITRPAPVSLSSL